MLTVGVREWSGITARKFRECRNAIEEVFESAGFQFFYSGALCPEDLYLKHLDVLGPDFIDNLICLDLKDNRCRLVVAPEGTFRVYDYAIRNNLKQGKIYYSQEFARNEETESVQKGKALSFWQIGFEIFGFPWDESSFEAIQMTLNCMQSCGLSEAIVRLSDKRVLQGTLIDLPIHEQRKVYHLIDVCDENGDRFAASYVDNGGRRYIADTVGAFLSCCDSNIEIRPDELSRYAHNELSSIGIESIKTLSTKIARTTPSQIRIVPFIAKSWDACNAMLFDVRMSGYPFALAGGGNLGAFEFAIDSPKSGAGIGVTRIVEYLTHYNHAKTKDCESYCQ